MPTNYTEIFEQAKKEKNQDDEKASESLKNTKAEQEDNASMQVGNAANMQAGNDANMEEGSKAEELVNLCVRVPKNWHREVKAYAALEEMTLAELIVLSVDQYRNRN